MHTARRSKLTRFAVFTILASLAFLALSGSGLMSGPSRMTGQQGRGRAVSPPQPPEVLAEPQAGKQELVAIFVDRRKTLRLDIAENGTRFTPDETPVFDDGLPAYGNEFITEGYIYPAGTLSGPNGANPDGSPEFPDKVIGRWVCRGWHVGDGAHTVSGPWVITHQLFDFDNTPGRVTIATDGFETPVVGAPIDRAITGGTGIYSEIRGDSTQVFMGFNQSLGVTLRVEIRPSKK